MTSKEKAMYDEMRRVMKRVAQYEEFISNISVNDVFICTPKQIEEWEIVNDKDILSWIIDYKSVPNYAILTYRMWDGTTKVIARKNA